MSGQGERGEGAAAAMEATFAATSGAGPAAEMGKQSGGLAGIPVPPFAVSSLSEPEFEALHRAVRPRGGSESWTQIPWQTDLERARQQAAREQKPLLLWIMDGHPLGCT